MSGLEIPFGVVGTVGVAPALPHMVKRSLEFFQSLRDAPQEVENARREVQSLHQILTNIDAARSAGDISPELYREIDLQLHFCSAPLNRLRIELSRYRVKRGDKYTIGNWKWSLMGKSKVTELTNVLNNNKATLSTAVDAITLKSSGQITSLVKRLGQLTSELDTKHAAVVKESKGTRDLVEASEQNAQRRDADLRAHIDVSTTETQARIESASEDVIRSIVSHLDASTTSTRREIDEVKAELSRLVQRRAPGSKVDDLIHLLAEFEGQDYATPLRKFFAAKSTVIDDGDAPTGDVANLDSLEEDFKLDSEDIPLFENDLSDRIDEYVEDGDLDLGLLAAVRANDVEAIEALLLRGANAETADSNGFRPLHIAACEDLQTTCKLLLRHGIDITARCRVGKTAAHYAVSRGFQSFLLQLLEAGMDPDVRDQAGRSLLHDAVQADRLHVLETLLDYNVDPNALDPEGYSPIELACAMKDSQQLAVLNVLLRGGADADKQLKSRRTLLHLAIQREWLQLADNLLERGVDANRVDIAGDTPLLLAIRLKRYEFIRSLLGAKVNLEHRKSGSTALHHAVSDTAALELLLNAGANANATTQPRNETPLLSAVNQGLLASVEVLVPHTDLSIRNEEGNVAMLVACTKARIDIFRVLAAWAPVSSFTIRNLKEHSVITIAARSINGSFIETLLSKGLDADEVLLPYHYRPIHYSATNSLAATKSLLNRGATVNAKHMSFERTPLYYSIVNNHLAITEELISRGAHVGRVQKGGTNAFSAAIWARHYDLARAILRKHPELLEAVNDSGMTVFMKACGDSKSVTMRILLNEGADPNFVNPQSGRSALDYLFLSRKGPNATSIEMMIDKGLDVNSKLQSLNMSPLCAAAQRGDAKTVELLLAVPQIEKNPVDGRGKTPLMIAAGRGHTSVVTVLIEHGVTVDHVDPSGATALFIAARGGYLEILRKLVDAKADIHRKSPEDVNAFQSAISGGSLECMTELLALGHDVNTLQCCGLTPFLFAVDRGKRQCAEFLVQKGADIGARSPRGLSAYEIALSKGNRDLASWILTLGHSNPKASVNSDPKIENEPHEHGDDKRPKEVDDAVVDADELNALDARGYNSLHRAIESRDLETVRLLCSQGIDVERPAQNRDSPILLAVQSGDGAILKLLLDAGANPESMTSTSAYPPIHMSKSREITDMLLEAGAFVDQKDRSGSTALLRAVRTRDLAQGKVLVERGADLEAADEIGWTPLALALSPDQESMAEMLIEAGCNLDGLFGISRLTSVMKAISRFENPKILELLISKGARLDGTNKFGETVIDIAVNHAKDEMLDVLIRNGADKSAVDKKGQSALIRQIRRSNLEGVKMMLAAGFDPLELTGIDGKDNKTTAIHFVAANSNRIHILELLLAAAKGCNERGLWPDFRDGIGRTPLMRAAEANCSNQVLFLKKQGADIDAQDKYGKTAVFRCLVAGRRESVRLLLEHGARAECLPCAALDEKRPNVLYHAILKNRTTDIAALLIKHGSFEISQPSDDDHFKISPLAFACILGKMDFVHLFLGEHPRLHPKLLATTIRHKQEVAAIAVYDAARLRISVHNSSNHITKDDTSADDRLARNKDIDSDSLEAAVYIALDRGMERLVVHAITNGLSPNIRKACRPGLPGRSLLHMAIWSQASENIIRSLIEHGAHASAIEGSDHVQPIFYLTLSRRRGQTKPLSWISAVFRLLYDHGASATYQTRSARTLLWNLVQQNPKNCVEVLRYLLEIGVDPTVRGPRGRTILHLCAKVGQAHGIRILLSETKVDAHALDAEGKTAFDLAMDSGKVHTVKALTPTVKPESLRRGEDQPIGAVQACDTYVRHLDAAISRTPRKKKSQLQALRSQREDWMHARKLLEARVSGMLAVGLDGEPPLRQTVGSEASPPEVVSGNIIGTATVPADSEIKIQGESNVWDVFRALEI